MQESLYKYFLTILSLYPVSELPQNDKSPSFTSFVYFTFMKVRQPTMYDAKTWNRPAYIQLLYQESLYHL